jgi:hypothetical protein
LDLLALIKKQIEALPDGPHIAGLRAVLRHIDAAYRHLGRGQSDGDDTAFTDAIYRANQAFEGSIKEAYRVLAERDPQRMRPYDIEKYLEEKQIFKDRICKPADGFNDHGVGAGNLIRTADRRDAV